MSNHTPNTITIQLTKGESTIIDMDDADLAELKWHTGHRLESDERYAVRNLRLTPTKRREQALHRVILERMLGRSLVGNERVDHINGDRLDNRRSNLRLANHSLNAANAKKSKRNTSGYKGVHWHKRRKKWYATIVYNRKNIHLGSFATPEEAHEAYKQAAVKFFGEFARFE